MRFFVDHFPLAQQFTPLILPLGFQRTVHVAPTEEQPCVAGRESFNITQLNSRERFAEYVELIEHNSLSWSISRCKQLITTATNHNTPKTNKASSSEVAREFKLQSIIIPPNLQEEGSCRF